MGDPPAVNEREASVSDDPTEAGYGVGDVVEFLAKVDGVRLFSKQQGSNVGMNGLECCDLSFVASFLFGERRDEENALERFVCDELVVVLLNVVVETFERR